MKTTILIILAVVIFSIMAGITVSFAAEARAYATVIIIVPERPKQEHAEVIPEIKAEEKPLVEESTQEEMVLVQNKSGEAKISE